MNLRAKLFAVIAAAMVIAFGAGSLSNAALWQWSKTASSNATADPSINWSEGMSPSSVNDSARAMMARVAEWRDDLSGLLVTGGTASAYTLTSNQGLASVPNNGQAIAFTASATNNAGATLRVDGGTTYALQSPAGTAISAGVLVAGSVYTVKYNSATTSWVLHSVYSVPGTVPIGALIDYTGTAAPLNFILPAGQCISRTTYATYFALVGTRYDVCDGSTTFGAPDLRGRMVAGLDNLGGTPANILTSAGSGCAGTTIGAECGQQNRALVQANLPNVSFAVSIPAGQGSHIHTGTIPKSAAIGAGVGAGTFIDPASTTQALTIDAATLPSMSGTAASGGSGTAFGTIPPLHIVTKILRVL